MEREDFLVLQAESFRKGEKMMKNKKSFLKDPALFEKNLLDIIEQQKTLRLIMYCINLKTPKSTRKI